ALAAVAVDSGDVRAGDSVVLEPLVEGPDAHRLHAFRDQIPDRIVDHRRHDAGLHAEAVRQVGGDVELTTADMDLALARLAKRDEPRIQAVDKGAQGHEVQRALLTDVQTVLHSSFSCGTPRCNSYYSKIPRPPKLHRTKPQMNTDEHRAAQPQPKRISPQGRRERGGSVPGSAQRTILGSLQSILGLVVQIRVHLWFRSYSWCGQASSTLVQR